MGGGAERQRGGGAEVMKRGLPFWQVGRFGTEVGGEKEEGRRALPKRAPLLPIPPDGCYCRYGTIIITYPRPPKAVCIIDESAALRKEKKNRMIKIK